ncbi:P-loop containing nucleoside triphosphate hydrolase protein, partial [Lentinula edodes]
CPTSTSTFTGRTDTLESLNNFFFDSEKTQKAFLLFGLGGAGKTQVALEFRKRFRQNSRFTKIYFITADTEESIQACLFDIAVDNGLVNPQDWRSGIHWLNTHEENWLIIMDNADDPRIPLRRYFPPCEHGNIIITSRNAELQNAVGQSLELWDMSPSEGLQLLVKHAAKGPLNKVQHKHAAQIAKELYYFPLALVQAGAYILKQNCLLTYSSRLKSQRRQLMERKLTQFRDKYQLSVYATWNLSWNMLSEKSQKLLEICSHLHHEKIPRQLFEKAITRINSAFLPLGPSKAVDEARALLKNFVQHDMQWDDIHFDEIVSEATSYSLLQIHSDELYTIHPLVYQWLVDSLHQRQIQGTQGILAVAVQNTTWKDYRFLQHLSPHCKSLGYLGHSNYFIKLAIGGMWELLGNYTQALELWKPLIDVMRKSLGHRHKDTLVHIENVVRVYWELRMYQEALELRRSLYVGAALGVQSQYHAWDKRPGEPTTHLAFQSGPVGGARHTSGETVPWNGGSGNIISGNKLGVGQVHRT